MGRQRDPSTAAEGDPAVAVDLGSPVGTHGRWQVVTETSLYVLDLDAKTAIRVPDAGSGSVDDVAVLVAALQRDYEAVGLLDLITARVGERLLLLLDVRGDGVPTRRLGTIVRAVRRLPDD